jgi:hypothetical protein
MMDLEGRFQKLFEETMLFIPHLVVAVVVFILTLLLSGLVARWVRRAAKIRIEDTETRRLLSRLARWSVIILGTMAALDQVDFDVTGFVAGYQGAGHGAQDVGWRDGDCAQHGYLYQSDQELLPTAYTSSHRLHWIGL